MKIKSRPYHDKADLARMWQLLVTGTQSGIPASYMHPGCLGWALYCPPDERARRRNIRLWQREDGISSVLEAWAIFLPHEETFDLFVHPSLYDTPLHNAVMDEYVAWAEERARDAGLDKIQPFWILDYDKTMDRLMKAHGFVVASVGPPPPLFERSLQDFPVAPLPNGFTIQGVKNLEDGRLRATVTYNAFGVKTAWDTYWANYTQFISSEVYDGERDLFVRSPDHQGAAACTIWFDPVNKVGLFEPVATHSDFQRQGLGKAVMAEGLRRMKAAGMQRAILGFDPDNTAARALYQSLGFCASHNFAVYRKDLT